MELWSYGREYGVGCIVAGGGWVVCSRVVVMGGVVGIWAGVWGWL